MATNLTQRLPAFACIVLALALALALSGGCASRAQSHDPTRPQELTLRGGERAEVAGGVLRYVRVLNDSRCPVDVQCVWAGDADVSFEFIEGSGEPRAFTLTLRRPTSALGGRWIHLVALGRGPAPEATVRIDGTPDSARP